MDEWGGWGFFLGVWYPASIFLPFLSPPFPHSSPPSPLPPPREWYGYHFPELARLVLDNTQYAKCVIIIGNRKSLTDDKLPDLEAVVMDTGKAEAILEAAKTSMGGLDVVVVGLVVARGCVVGCCERLCGGLLREVVWWVAARGCVVGCCERLCGGLLREVVWWVVARGCVVGCCERLCGGLLREVVWWVVARGCCWVVARGCVVGCCERLLLGCCERLCGGLLREVVWWVVARGCVVGCCERLCGGLLREVVVGLLREVVWWVVARGCVVGCCERLCGGLLHASHPLHHQSSLSHVLHSHTADPFPPQHPPNPQTINQPTI